MRERRFQCREGLWDAFAQMARDERVSIDELLEEALVAYARARGHLEVQTAKRPPVDLDETADAEARRALREHVPPGRSARAGPAPARAPATQPAGRAPPPPMQRPRTAPLATAPPGRALRQHAAPPPPAPPSVARPPATQRLGHPPQPQPVATPTLTLTLTLTYEGQSYVVDKDRYLLGRSKTQADLRLDDSNVSRQHAMIERVQGGSWFVVDLGSTNGVWVDGERVARRAIRDGDVLEITTHRIVCRIV